MGLSIFLWVEDSLIFVRWFGTFGHFSFIICIMTYICVSLCSLRKNCLHSMKISCRFWWFILFIYDTVWDILQYFSRCFHYSSVQCLTFLLSMLLWVYFLKYNSCFLLLLYWVYFPSTFWVYLESNCSDKMSSKSLSILIKFLSILIEFLSILIAVFWTANFGHILNSFLSFICGILYYYIDLFVFTKY